MQYSIEQYDKHGFLQAPIWLWLGWLFLAKAWIVFVIAGVSRDTGTEVLEIIYPDPSVLYIGLIAGIPAILMLWLFGLRHPERPWVMKFIYFGKPVTQLVVLGQAGLVAYQIYLERGYFSWPNAITIVGLLWLMIFVSKSRRVRDCFRSPLLK